MISLLNPFAGVFYAGPAKVRQVRQNSGFLPFVVRSRCGMECQSRAADAKSGKSPARSGESGPNARAYTQGLYPSPEGERVVNSRPKFGMDSC